MSEIKVSTEGFHCVNNAVVYDLDESLIASGYPMRTSAVMLDKASEADLERGRRLNNIVKKTGNGAHNQFMTGVRVAFDLTFSNKAWVEAERYRFLEFVSSQSTMHRITKFEIHNQYNKYVDPRIIEIMTSKTDEYNGLLLQRDKLIENQEWAKDDELREIMQEKYLEILYSNPAGFELTARLTTNYRCLQNIYKQRYDHRLPEWVEFCNWIKTLPYARELILCDS